MNHKVNLFLLLVILASCLKTNASLTQPIHGGWTFGQARLTTKYPATVPGVVHTDLMDNNIIDDPYMRLNERGVQWVDKEDWVYETTFTPEADMIGKENISLCFDGLDTYADVFLNDSLILSADNMFRRWEVPVKALIKGGENTLRVYLHSPIKVDMPKWEKTPYRYSASNDQSENGGVFDRKLSMFARKAGYHYGWDWGPRLVTSGIWRPVYLKGWDDARIDNVYIRSHNVSAKKADISDEVNISASRDMKNVTVLVRDENTGKVLASTKCDLKKGDNMVPVNFSIKNPNLWWSNGLGNPDMYTFKTEIQCEGKTIDCNTTKAGIRDIKVVTDWDADGHMQFYFVLNGVPVFAKGTNYIPQDNFLTAVDETRYRTTLRDAADANMNMVRVWGGGIYENDIFYDICDELGLMVWQDFMFACSVYPASGEWLENVAEEAADNIIRLRNHPSVALWCGGNECLDAWYNWGWKRKLERESPGEAAIVEEELNRQYFETLPEAVASYAPDSFYWPSSPFSAQGRGSDGVNGDRHFWTVWHGKAPIDTYNKEQAHFFSEYGMQSFPEYSSLVKFIPDSTEHYIQSEPMMSHQRGGDHANSLIEWYLESEYKHPEDFKDFLYATHVMQADAMRTAIEAHRRDKPYCMGSILWQHDDCWPVASWATRDYYGKWKGAHYLVKKAFENVIASAVVDGDSLNIYVVSDLLKDAKGRLTLTSYTCDGKKIAGKAANITIPANTSTPAWKIPVDQLTEGYDPEDVIINVGISGKDSSRNGNDFSHCGNYFLCKHKDLNLLPADIKMTVTPAEGGYDVELVSDNFVRAVWLSSDDDSIFITDNCFDLLPAQPKKTFVRTASPSAPSLTIQSLNNI